MVRVLALLATLALAGAGRQGACVSCFEEGERPDAAPMVCLRPLAAPARFLPILVKPAAGPVGHEMPPPTVRPSTQWTSKAMMMA